MDKKDAAPDDKHGAATAGTTKRPTVIFNFVFWVVGPVGLAWARVGLANDLNNR